MSGRREGGRPGEAAGPGEPDGAAGDRQAAAPGDVAELGWDALEARIVGCRLCPRLVEHRERVAREKRAAFADEEYWGRPVPGFGDRRAALLVVGLAPAAHGANRTGRMFTGDRSGDWLYRAMHRAGFASQPASRRRDDGLELRGAFVTAPVRCAPPGNRPKPRERRNCRPYLEREIDLLEGDRGPAGAPAGGGRRGEGGPGVRVIVALGGFAWDHVLRIYRDRGHDVPSPKPRFGHGEEAPLGASAPVLLGSYHPSQQNTFTGTLSEEMLDAVFSRARDLVAGEGAG